MNNYLENDVYKNSVESPNIFSKINPEYFIEIEEAILEPELIISTDPEILKIQENNNTDYEAEQERVLELYETDPHRLSNRLYK